jgi:hypothetical protein
MATTTAATNEASTPVVADNPGSKYPFASVSLSDGDLTAIITKVSELKGLLPLMPDLTPTERQRMSKLGNKSRAFADLALETLQIWVLGKNERLVCDFLDALAIKHDGKGLIDDLPAEPDAKKVSAAVEAILAKYSPEDVWIYLHLFAGMDTPWPHLKGLLMTHPAFAPEALTA